MKWNMANCVAHARTLWKIETGLLSLRISIFVIGFRKSCTFMLLIHTKFLVRKFIGMIYGRCKIYDEFWIYFCNAFKICFFLSTIYLQATNELQSRDYLLTFFLYVKCRNYYNNFEKRFFLYKRFSLHKINKSTSKLLTRYCCKFQFFSDFIVYFD